GAKVLPILNGIEHIDILQKELGEEQVIGGLSFIIATLDENGHVVHSSNQHDLVFGPLHPAQEEICHSFTSACEKANMNSRLSPSILEELWQKYMFITAFSGMTTAANLPIGVLRESETTMETIREVLMEVKELADAYHVQLEDKHVEAAIQQILTFPAESTSSMHQDKRKGLTLEVDHLQGGAIRLAQKADLHLPVVKTLYSLIKPYENGAIK
ncbi:MAG TPA: 2-dehydropantoate 2-reductase, partial [Chondromyces sp.]|nr:2-dehydropantoate 2-reductase [Chondromyces sp.]